VRKYLLDIDTVTCSSVIAKFHLIITSSTIHRYYFHLSSILPSLTLLNTYLKQYSNRIRAGRKGSRNCIAGMTDPLFSMRSAQVWCLPSFISDSYWPQNKTWSPLDGGHCRCGAGDCWLELGRLDCYWQDLYYYIHTEPISDISSSV